ncbi:CHRD domain-containing protein [Parafilimonas sp.]|uniref:CHRD domain-containing protein n=1 Tax=Parafilimonas sp. TaxID=1969739 RepID=UPI003F7DCF55
MKLKFRKSQPVFTIIVATIICFCACSKDHDNPDNNSIKFSTSLDQSQETPPTGEAGTGSCTATYDKNTNELKYTLTWSGLTGAPTAMHFHKADIGEPGDVEIPITGFAASTSGTLEASAIVDEDEEEDLLEDKFYVNIHTAAHTGGEIRGQMIKQ